MKFEFAWEKGWEEGGNVRDFQFRKLVARGFFCPPMTKAVTAQKPLAGRGGRPTSYPSLLSFALLPINQSLLTSHSHTVRAITISITITTGVHVILILLREGKKP